MAPRLLIAALAVLAAAGCGGGGDFGEEGPESKLSDEAQKALDEAGAQAELPDPAAEIGRLLRERARALEAGDLPALSATATGAQRARDRRNARRVGRLDVERVRLVADDVQTSGDRAKLTAAMSYRVKGMSRTFRARRRVSVRKSPAGWRVTREVARGRPLPWEVAPFELTRAPHVVLFTAPGVDAGPLRSGLADAYRDIRRDLPARDLPGSVLVIATRDPAQTEQLAGKLSGGVIALANVDAVYGPAPGFPVERVRDQRMIVVDSRWSPLPPEARQSVLVHEMTHTALGPDTSARTPAWLVEGVAMHVAGEDRSEQARLRAAGAAPAIELRRICGRHSMVKLVGSESAAAYDASTAAAEAIVARHGTKGLFRLYDAFNDQRFDGPTCAAMMNRVMRRTIGMSVAQLEAAVAAG